MNEAERRRRISEGYGRGLKERRWVGRDRHPAWANAIKREVLKLERMGEEMDPALLAWAKGTQ